MSPVRTLMGVGALVSALAGCAPPIEPLCGDSGRFLGDVLVDSDRVVTALDGCQVVEGTVTVRANQATSDSYWWMGERHLADTGAPSLVQITGSLQLQDDTYFDPAWFSGLTLVGGALEVGSVSTLAGLDALAETGSVQIEQSDLKDLDGLQSLTRTGSLILIGNFRLESLRGLESLRQIGPGTLDSGFPASGELTIRSHGPLVDISALGGVEEVDGDVNLSFNEQLVDVSLPALRRVGGTLRIGYNPSLETVTGMEGLASVRVLEFWDNEKLIDAGNWASLEVLDELTVFNSPFLTQARFPALVEVVGSLGITTAGFVDLAGFTVLQRAGSLALSDARDLASLHGLERLERLGSLSIGGTGVVDLDALAGVRTVDPDDRVGQGFFADISLRNNPALQRVDGLHGITTFVGALEVYNNIVLAPANVAALADALDVECLSCICNGEGTIGLECPQSLF